MQLALALALLAIVAVSGCTTAVTSAPSGQQAQAAADGTVVQPDGTMIKPDGTVVPPEEGAAAPVPEQRTAYVDYTPEAFAAAKASGKTTYLYFFATWCPICRAHDPTVADAIAAGPEGVGFDAEQVAAFRVNYDVRGDAHAACQPLYQHFTCILQGNAVAFKTGAVQDKQTIISTLSQYA